MDHSPLPRDNGEDIDQDFLNLTLSIRTTSLAAPMAAEVASPLPMLSSRSPSIIPPSSNPTSSSSLTPRSSNPGSSSSIAPPNSNPASSPSITPPTSSPYHFDPTSYHQQIWYHQPTAVGSPSYVGSTTFGTPWFYQPTAVGGSPSYHQSKEIGGPWVHQPPVIGGSSHLQPATDPSTHQSTSIGSQSHPQPIGGPQPQSMAVGGLQPHSTAVGGLPAHQPTVVRGPLHQQLTSFGRPSPRQPTAGRGPFRHQTTAIRGKIRKKCMKRQTAIRLKPGKIKTIPPPYPWATEHRAILHDLQHIQSKGINTITGKVKCRECHREFEIEYDLQTKFKEVQRFVIENKDAMSQRAPDVWRSPAVPDCKFCNQKKCAKPIWGERRSINWLFLLLGQMIGCCKLAELKYFCKHTRNHRTGAKDRLLYAAYLELCRQLDPDGDYDP